MVDYGNSVGRLFNDVAEALAALFQRFLRSGPLLDFGPEQLIRTPEFLCLLFELSLESLLGLTETLLVSLDQEHLLLFEGQILDEHDYEAEEPYPDRAKIQAAPETVGPDFHNPFAHADFSGGKNVLENPLKPGHVTWTRKE
jgi:hypothetical protein